MANIHVNPNLGTGGNNGSDWTNAFRSFPSMANITRGDVIYLADGTYGSVTLDKAASGTTVITIKKATESDHGSSTGWTSALGDGQAVFGDIVIDSDDWTIDGQRRNESDWADGDAYGIRATKVFNRILSPDIGADDVTLRYLNLGGDEGDSFVGDEPTEAVYVAGFEGDINRVTVSKCYLHNIAHGTHIMFIGIDDGLIEDCYFKNGFGKESIRGGNNNKTKNVTIRRCIFDNVSGGDETGEEGGSTTAPIGIWGANNSGDLDNIHVYGVVIKQTNTSMFNTGPAIIIGGDGSSWLGVAANNCLVYNVTIVGQRGSNGVSCDVLINGGTGNVCRNVLAYDNQEGPASFAANTVSNNINAGANPFVNYPSNLHLSGAQAGTSTGSPAGNAADIDGVTRGADGVWDVGAFEFDASPGGGSSTRRLAFVRR